MVVRFVLIVVHVFVRASKRAEELRFGDSMFVKVGESGFVCGLIARAAEEGKVRFVRT